MNWASMPGATCELSYVALSGGSMMMAVIYIAKHYPWISGLIAAGVIVQTFIIGIAATRNTIRNRDLD
ncbi:hypothetical protein PMJ11TS3_68690 [Paenibacillus melissococcoides]